jgi:basic membrane protein A
MKNKGIFTAIIALLLTAVFVLSSCVPVVAAERPIRAAVVLAGMLGDLSYNDKLKEGTDRAVADFGVQVRLLEARGTADYEGNLIAAIAAGYDLVIVQGSAFIDMLAQQAALHPNRMFAITDAIMNPIPPNVTCAAFAPNEGQFLVGAVMAMLSSRTEIPGITGEKRVGWISGIETPNIRDFWAGFQQGVHYIDPEIQILQAFAGSFSDPVRGKELALAQFEQGVSVIAQVASRTGLGIIEAAAETGRFAIGVDSDQDSIAPGHVVTSMLKHIDQAVYAVIEAAVNGTFQGGGFTYMDLAAGGIGLTDFSVFRAHIGEELFPQDIVDKAEELAQRIINGDIVVNTFPGIRPWERD